VDNSYYLYKPKGHDPARDSKLPVIVEIHGGGFTGGAPKTTATLPIQDAVNRGIAYISVGYRLIGTQYYYGQGESEELLHVDADGRITLDTSGKTMDSYQVRRGRQELVVKCQYDTAQMIEHLIAHADQYGIDIHRISTTGGSAGGGEIHYLTWVYHQWNVGRYTPVGMVYNMAQLDYPVENVMDNWATLWGDDVGYNTKLSTILSKSDCDGIIGNPCCINGGTPPSCYSPHLCNKEYHEKAISQFCGQDFQHTTFGDIKESLKWPSDDPEVGPGMEKLWYNSANMQKHAPKPFYLYIHNELNGTTHMEIVHNAMHARNYAKFAEKAGINFTVYYTDYNAMTPDDKGDKRFSVPGRFGSEVLNYRSSHDWVHQPGAQSTQRASPQEQMQFHCLAFGMDCSSGPSPGPSPPGPSPSPSGDLSPSCKKAIDANCPIGGDCQQCIGTHARQFMAAGCPPPAEQGSARCIAYCKNRGGTIAV